MAGIYATNGARVYIGGVMAASTSDLDESDFAAQSWQEIGWVESIGAFGDTSAEVTFDAIAQQRTQKVKGTRNAGNMDLVMGIDWSDLGQQALIAAEQTPYDYAFKVEFNDAPEGGTPSTRMFIAKVMSIPETLDTANNVMKLTASLGVNSNIVRVSAAEGV